MLGLHTGDTGVRAADALYTLLVGYSCVWLFGAGGVDEQGKSADPNALEHAVRASASMLSAGLLLYASLRVLRAGLVHAAEVDGAVVAPAAHLAGNVSASGPRFTARAYAHASETSTLSAAFGGSVGIGAALVLAANAPHLRFGLEAVSLQLAVAAPSAAAAAAVATLAASEQQTQLPTLFGAGTCAGAAGDCSAAAEGRRFAVANTPSDALWLLALGLAVLALPTRRRRAGAALGAIADGSVPWGAALFGVLVVFVAALVHCTFVGPQAYVDAVALAVLGGAAWALAVDLWSGAAVGAIGYVVFLVLASEELGPFAVFSQLTNVSLACLVGALVLLLLLDATTLLCVFGWYPTARAVLAVAGTSIALLLLLAKLVSDARVQRTALCRERDRPATGATSAQVAAPASAAAPCVGSGVRDGRGRAAGAVAARVSARVDRSRGRRCHRVRHRSGRAGCRGAGAGVRGRGAVCRGGGGRGGRAVAALRAAVTRSHISRNRSDPVAPSDPVVTPRSLPGVRKQPCCDGIAVSCLVPSVLR